MIPPKTRTFNWIVGIENGILIRTEKDDMVKVLCPLLNTVLPQGEKTKTCVCGKSSGLFIGFLKHEMTKLEVIAKNLRSEQQT